MVSGKRLRELLSWFLTISVVLPAGVQAQPGYDAKVENVRFEQHGYVTDILYDLIGFADAKYQITVNLRRRSNESLNRELVVAEGDIGAGVSPGNNKRVVWGRIGEFPQGLPGNDYYFVVTAQQVASESHTALWVGAGVFVLCVVIFSFLLTGHPRSELAGAGLPSPHRRPRLSSVHR